MTERRFTKEIGSEYELYKLASPFYDALHKEITNLLKAKCDNLSSAKVLEIGFGTGATSKAILDASETIRLMAMDNEPMMLPKAQQFLKPYVQDKRITLKVGDALAELKEMRDNEYDAVVSGFVLHNFLHAYRSDCLAEIYRALKPNGLFINGDKIAADNPQEHQKNYEWQIEQFQVYKKMGKPELTDEWVEHYKEDEKPDRILYQKDFLPELGKLGFQEVSLVQRWYMDAIVRAVK